ncbi:DNA-processing protein DprA [Candidatus Woesebacteria bacterium]|nr:DNA-processing protein DprA [Candidatus Woesebacteria bacterium]
MEISDFSNGSLGFPHRLLEVKPPIKKLWYRGEWREELSTKTVAVVGSRRMSRYGRSVIEEVVPKLCSAGFTIISGLMYGVDQLAHKITLEQGGVAVAVLGWGIERANDPESDRMADEIVAHGGVVMSEYPGETRGQLWTFPQRNRIVVGLSDIVIVVEAGVKSGTMSTVRWAEKMSKPVYAVPGSMFSSTSEGANFMIETGMAKPLTPSVIDLLIGRGSDLLYKNTVRPVLLGVEKVIYEQLELLGPQSINELARSSGGQVGEILSALASLEMNGVVVEERGIFGIV